MGDNVIVIGPREAVSVPQDGVVTLGGSVLDHALQRLLVSGRLGEGCSEPDPIATHDSHV
jgi:hypothetical protein